MSRQERQALLLRVSAIAEKLTDTTGRADLLAAISTALLEQTGRDPDQLAAQLATLLTNEIARKQSHRTLPEQQDQLYDATDALFITTPDGGYFVNPEVATVAEVRQENTSQLRYLRQQVTRRSRAEVDIAKVEDNCDDPSSTPWRQARTAYLAALPHAAGDDE